MSTSHDWHRATHKRNVEHARRTAHQQYEAGRATNRRLREAQMNAPASSVGVMGVVVRIIAFLLWLAWMAWVFFGVGPF